MLTEFTREVKDWIISNDYSIKKRDANNQPILDDEGNEIKELAFDSFQAMLMQFLEPFLRMMMKKLNALTNDIFFISSNS